MKTCMVVDATDVVRKVAARIVVGMGEEAIGAASGNEAIDLLLKREEMPEFVIVGGNLDDMAADEVVRTIRAMPGATRRRSWASSSSRTSAACSSSSVRA